MVFDVIAVHVQDVHDDLKRLISRLSDLPSSESVKHVEGATTSIAGKFTERLTEVALDASKATMVVIEELNKTDSAVRAAVEELTAHDNELATGTDQVEASLPGAASTPSSKRTSMGGYGQGGAHA